jgi:hypothetical protein
VSRLMYRRPFSRLLDGRHELVQLAPFREIAEGARAQRAPRELRRGVHAQHECGKGRPQPANLLDELEAAHAWERNIRDHHVPVVAA